MLAIAANPQLKFVLQKYTHSVQFQSDTLKPALRQMFKEMKLVLLQQEQMGSGTKSHIKDKEIRQ